MPSSSRGHSFPVLGYPQHDYCTHINHVSSPERYYVSYGMRGGQCIIFALGTLDSTDTNIVNLDHGWKSVYWS